MSDKHLSSQFDADLNAVSSKVLEMGGLVESQIINAMQALNTFDIAIADQVIAAEVRLNTMEVEIDEECSNIIARRQPAARDLRLLMAISKTITNLERAGDEAEKIAKRVKRINEDGAGAHGEHRRDQALGRDGGDDPAPRARRVRAPRHGRRRADRARRQGDRRGIPRVRAQAHYVHDGRPAHDFGGPRLSVHREGDRADRRPCEEHRRVHHLHREGHGRAAHVARRSSNAKRSVNPRRKGHRGADAQQYSRHRRRTRDLRTDFGQSATRGTLPDSRVQRASRRRT